jgi:hypothetical protein
MVEPAGFDPLPRGAGPQAIRTLPKLQLIVGQAVTQETNDKKQLIPMIMTIEQQWVETPRATARRRWLLLGREHGRGRRDGH